MIILYYDMLPHFTVSLLCCSTNSRGKSYALQENAVMLPTSRKHRQGVQKEPNGNISRNIKLGVNSEWSLKRMVLCLIFLRI